MGKSGQIAYLNGDFIPIEKAQISPQDRGFLFGDGVYEVIPVYSKRLFTFEPHLKRLKNSLAATDIMNPLDDAGWRKLLQKLVDMHPWPDQFIYLQVTRGVQMQRDHLPADNLTPTLYAYTNELKPVSDDIQIHGIKAITLDDLRWQHCDIKAITLLPNILMKMTAKQQGADDAILIEAREKFSEAIDSLKKEKIIKATLELEIAGDISMLPIEESKDLEDWFVVSALKTASEGEQLASFEVEGKTFTVHKATAAKCPRCWRFTSTAEDCVCERCAKVLGESA